MHIDQTRAVLSSHMYKVISVTQLCSWNQEDHGCASPSFIDLRRKIPVNNTLVGKILHAGSNLQGRRHHHVTCERRLTEEIQESSVRHELEHEHGLHAPYNCKCLYYLGMIGENGKVLDVKPTGHEFSSQPSGSMVVHPQTINQNCDEKKITPKGIVRLL